MGAVPPVEAAGGPVGQRLSHPPSSAKRGRYSIEDALSRVSTTQLAVPWLQATAHQVAGSTDQEQGRALAPPVQFRWPFPLSAAMFEARLGPLPPLVSLRRGRPGGLRDR